MAVYVGGRVLVMRFGGCGGRVVGLDFWSAVVIWWVYVLANCARVPWWIPVWFVAFGMNFLSCY